MIAGSPYLTVGSEYLWQRNRAIAAIPLSWGLPHDSHVWARKAKESIEEIEKRLTLGTK